MGPRNIGYGMMFGTMVLAGLIPEVANAQKATKLFAGGQVEKAEQYCAKQKEEKQQDCYQELAEAYFRRENYSKAAEHYARTKTPSEGYQKVADGYFEVKDYDNALVYLDKIEDQSKIVNEWLKRATSRSNVEIAKLMLEKGADPNYVDEKDLRPLFYTGFDTFAEAVAMTPAQRIEFYVRKQEVFAMLIEKGADVNAVTTHNDGAMQTPILSSAFNGSGLNPEIMKLLIDSGAEVNVVSGWGGKTPLHLVVENHSWKAAGYLIEAGIDVTATMPDGKTALQLALAQDEELLSVSLQLFKVLLGASKSRNPSEESLYQQLLKCDEVLASCDPSEEACPEHVNEEIRALEIFTELRGDTISPDPEP